MTTVTGSGVVDMKLLAVKMRTADPRLKKALRKKLTDAARPVARRVQDSILSMPAHDEAGLRAETAATVKVTSRISRSGISVSIVSYGGKMPAGKESLPKHLDSSRGWGHPVWGHRDRWVRQRGKPQWFETPPTLNRNEFRSACEAAMNETARQLT